MKAIYCPRCGQPCDEHGIPVAAAWVSVVDRLPDERQLVVVSASEEYDVAYHNGEQWLGHAMSYDPTHWREIPEGPSWRPA